MSLLSRLLFFLAHVLRCCCRYWACSGFGCSVIPGASWSDGSRALLPLLLLCWSGLNICLERWGCSLFRVGRLLGREMRAPPCVCCILGAQCMRDFGRVSGCCSSVGSHLGWWMDGWSLLDVRTRQKSTTVRPHCNLSGAMPSEFRELPFLCFVLPHYLNRIRPCSCAGMHHLKQSSVRL